MHRILILEDFSVQKCMNVCTYLSWFYCTALMSVICKYAIHPLSPPENSARLDYFSDLVTKHNRRPRVLFNTWSALMNSADNECDKTSLPSWDSFQLNIYLSPCCSLSRADSFLLPSPTIAKLSTTLNPPLTTQYYSRESRIFLVEYWHFLNMQSCSHPRNPHPTPSRSKWL